jgi:hypothetical protein
MDDLERRSTFFPDRDERWSVELDHAYAVDEKEEDDF